MRQRRRLLVLAFSVGAAFLLLMRLSDSSFLRLLTQFGASPQRQTDPMAIDNRLDTTASGEIQADTFVPAPKPAEPDKTPQADLSPAAISKDDWAGIRDDSPSTQDEQSISLRIFDLLQRSTQQEIDHASIGPITYAQLFRQPSLYRGRFVTVSGNVRRVGRIELFPNDYGLKAYYQLWLYPSDNPTSPMVVYCLELPDGFPAAMQTAEQIQVTGLFFKRWAYQAKDTLRTAPTLLAKSFEWQHRPVMTPEPVANTWLLPVVIVATAFLALFAAGMVYRRTRLPPLKLPERMPTFLDTSIAEELKPKSTHGDSPYLQTNRAHSPKDDQD